MYDFVIGVPFSGCDEFLPEECHIATREDEAVAIAVGAWLTGKKPLCYMQNSGFGHCIDIITSLLIPYNIRINLLVNNRTKPYHHYLMGRITKPLAHLLKYDEITFC
jgi:phosphonopyruvate decarboxylase